MNLVDSSGWLEYLADGPRASFFEKPLKNIESLIVPTICLYEVFKTVVRERGENDALQAIALMRQCAVIDLDQEIALLAARISLDFKLPMADSIILATAQAHKAIIWTQDSDFKNFRDVRYCPKAKNESRS
jgi:predicted nucleic acid-binding protein